MQPPFGDVDDRIRAIAHRLNLRTILWQYDSQDWQVDATPDYTPEMVYREYQTMIDDANKGMFDKVSNSTSSAFFVGLRLFRSAQ